MSKFNPRITARERGLIKGNLRRSFARSELHRQVIEAAIIHDYSDPERPRVKTWCRCNICKKPEAKSSTKVDHIIPVIPIDSSFEELGANETIDRLWCDISNLQACCVTCHKTKTQQEMKERRRIKKLQKIK